MSMEYTFIEAAKKVLAEPGLVMVSASDPMEKIRSHYGFLVSWDCKPLRMNSSAIASMWRVDDEKS